MRFSFSPTEKSIVGEQGRSLLTMALDGARALLARGYDQSTSPELFTCFDTGHRIKSTRDRLTIVSPR
jgi:hypothetical protein